MSVMRPQRRRSSEVRRLAGAPDQRDAIDSGAGLGVRHLFPQLECPFVLGARLRVARATLRAVAGLHGCAAKTRTGVTRSELEDTFEQLRSDFNLPPCLTNVRLSDGYTADVVFPEHGLIVELDSWEFHGDRISFESNRDRDADNLAHGLPTIRVTHERMKADPAKEAERVRQTLSWLERQRRTG
jgi:hypothetical protein